MISEKAQYYVEKLQMQLHPEGGWYKETYRANGVIPSGVLQSFNGDRNYATGIYFLLTAENFSAFHRIASDEMWHFYDGDGLLIHEIDEQGNYTQHGLGLNLDALEKPQLVIPAKSWFASEVKPNGSWCLVGCTVAPGFDFKDFEMPTERKLLGLFPQHSQVITRLTRT